MVSKIDQHIDIESNGGKPQGKVQTEIDVPAKGIHKSVVQQLPEYQTLTENGNRRTESFPEPGNGVRRTFSCFSDWNFKMYPLFIARQV